MVDYFIIERGKREFQKLLDQWKHSFRFEIIWMYYDKVFDRYHALIKREPKCPHGTLGGREKCIKCGIKEGF